MVSVNLTAISDPYGCAGGQCPTVYRGDDGKLFIKGWRVNDAVRSAASPNEHEDLVEVPEALLASLRL